MNIILLPLFHGFSYFVYITNAITTNNLIKRSTIHIYLKSKNNNIFYSYLLAKIKPQRFIFY